MKISSRNISFVHAGSLTLLFAALPTLAYAHPGEAGGLMHGLMHPFTGLDHVCAMIAVGLWAAQMGGRAAWLVPSAFVAVMMQGGLLGRTEIIIPFVETGIAMSLLLLGLLIATAARLPLALTAILAGVFALLHGYVHGIAMPQGDSTFAYFAGLVWTSILLTLSGFSLGMLVRKHMLRFAGVAVAIAGGYLWFAV